MASQNASGEQHTGDEKLEKITEKNQDKIKKKLSKIKTKLSTKEGIKFCKSPSKILCVQNGGLGNDVSQEELLLPLSAYGDVAEIIMIPRKQFCFVCFIDEQNALQALTNLNGHLLKKGQDPSQDVILYFMFVEEAPPNVLPSKERPPGLMVIEDFIDEEKENELLLFVNTKMLSIDDTAAGQMKHRRVLHFGYEFKYGINDVDVNEPLPRGIPDICRPFLQKAQDMGIVSHFPDQLTINQYAAGQGIPPHIDTPPAFEDGIMSLSIGSQAVMDFRHSQQEKHLSILLPRRSLLVMIGESRYHWTHGITPRKSDIIAAGEGKGLTLLQRGMRTSFTFRKVIKDRRSPEKENLGSQKVPQTEDEAVALEKAHVHKVYNDIADHFSGTRYKPWPRVIDFVLEQPSYSLVADVGCGNGKCLGARKDLFEIGCDYSSNLASICYSRGFQTCVADVTCLPLRSQVFDAALCIAVIHHMATRERRIRAISEVMRILRQGGKALIYVWALEQNWNQNTSKYIKSNRQKQVNFENQTFSKESPDPNKSTSCPFDESSDQSIGIISTRRKENSEDTAAEGDCDSSSDTKTDHASSCPTAKSDLLREAHYANQEPKNLQVHVNRTQFQDQDMLVPWKLKGQKTYSKENSLCDSSVSTDFQLFHRYYHVFRQGELEALCKRVPNCEVCKSYYDQGNWCVVLEKL